MLYASVDKFFDKHIKLIKLQLIDYIFLTYIIFVTLITLFYFQFLAPWLKFDSDLIFKSCLRDIYRKINKAFFKGSK